MGAETSPAVKIMIKSGLLPENVLQQLVGWRLLPEHLKNSCGGHPEPFENEWSSVEEFLADLRNAHDTEALLVRETELVKAGGYFPATLACQGEDICCDVFIDRLGRVVLPGGANVEKITGVSVRGANVQKVLNREPRYRGDQIIAWVLYLESEVTSV